LLAVLGVFLLLQFLLLIGKKDRSRGSRIGSQEPDGGS
jgi:hypothetical protein